MASEFARPGIPEKIQIWKDFQHLCIARKWFRFKFIHLTLLVIVWDALVINWYATASSSAYQSSLNFFFALLPLVQITVGIGLTYYALAGYLNKTVIDVDLSLINIRNEPLPFWGNKKISSKIVIQLYYTDETLNTRAYYRSFAIYAITSEQRCIKLVSGIENSKQASFIVQEIEKFLYIEDKLIKK